MELEKVACCMEHKSGNVSKTRKDRKSYYGRPIGTHQRSFKSYHPRPPTASPSPTLGFSSHPKFQSLLSQKRVKLRTSNLARTITGSIRTKAHEKFWRKGSVGVSRDFPIFFGYPYYLSNGKSYETEILHAHLGSIKTKAH